MINLAILASGNGTNAQRLIEYFHDHHYIRISLIISNKAEAYVLKRAEATGIRSVVFSAKEFHDALPVADCLRQNSIDFIVLAGFLLMIPREIIIMYENRIVNIHPALLPAYGGKGMYGMHVHREVLRNREKESGITVHFVNENYDDGMIIFQTRCQVDAGDTPESLAEKIHALEYKYFPKVVEDAVLHCFPPD